MLLLACLDSVDARCVPFQVKADVLVQDARTRPSAVRPSLRVHPAVGSDKVSNGTDPSFSGQRRARVESRPAAEHGQDRGAARSGRAPSSLRAPRGLTGAIRHADGPCAVGCSSVRQAPDGEGARARRHPRASSLGLTRIFRVSHSGVGWSPGPGIGRRHYSGSGRGAPERGANSPTVWA